MASTEPDPIRLRRARMARLAGAGRRLGYGSLGVALAAFATGAATGFTTLVVTAVVAALILGSIVLLPAIVVGYGVRAAERDDPTGRRPGARSGPRPPVE